MSTFLTPEEYLATERVAERKSEYRAGEVFAMSGASKKHNLIAGNIFASIHQQLKGRSCEVYIGDMRVKVSSAGLYTYPDISVACGDILFDGDQKDTLKNPTVIIEVLSDSTEAYDRGMKFEHYRKLESLVEYVLVSQDKPHLEVFVRQPDGTWIFSEAKGLQAEILLSSINCLLALADIYDKTGV
jgi:Uma2 family endonuclease